MGDRRTFVFPSLLFAVLFVLITLTGYFQVTIIQENIEDLLRSEGETLFQHLQREINVSLEYLDLLDKSPSLITPKFLNIMAYDEAIVEDIYSSVSSISDIKTADLPFNDCVVFDLRGTVLTRKGRLDVPAGYVRALVTGKQETVVKTPTDHDKSLFMGIRLKTYMVFFSLADSELEKWRKKYIVRDIIERAEKGFNVVGITIYDPKHKTYLTFGKKEKNGLVVTKPLDSKFLPDYRMEILVSETPARRVFERSTFSLIVVLVILLVAGGISTYLIYLLERRHEGKMRELEKEMALKERLVSLGKLASGMAHEIRNPLNAISISVQRLKREFTPEPHKQEEYQHFLDITRAELMRVDRIVEDFLLSTKAQAPFLEEKLRAILDEVIIILGEKARSKGITVVNRADGDTVVSCQKERLKQAFHNIILNAIEAIVGDGGKITVSSRRTDDHMDISIKDSGVGIGEEALTGIFEYFFTTKDKGMGLGLPISYMIVRDHGGNITVSSKKGEGTTFVVSLPAARGVAG